VPTRWLHEYLLPRGANRNDEHSHADDDVSHQIEEVWLPMVIFVILAGLYWLVFYKK
jgi:hypothetical protein